MRRPGIVLIALTLALSWTTAGCSGPSPTTTPSGASPAGTDRTPPSTTEAAVNDACTSAVLLPVVRQILDNPASGLHVERIEIAACRNGYARVFAVPYRSDPPVEGDQVFLILAGGRWVLVDRGAAIDCGNADLAPATAAACKVLA